MVNYFDTDHFDYDVKCISFLGLGKEGEVYKFLFTLTSKSTGQKKEIILAGKRLVKPFISLRRHFDNLYALQELGLTLYTVRQFHKKFMIQINNDFVDSRHIIFMTDLSNLERTTDIVPINVKYLLNSQFISKFSVPERVSVYKKIISDSLFLCKRGYYMIDIDAWMVFRQEKPVALMVDVGSLHHTIFSFYSRLRTASLFNKLWWMINNEPEEIKDIVSKILLDTGLLDTDSLLKQ